MDTVTKPERMQNRPVEVPSPALALGCKASPKEQNNGVNQPPLATGDRRRSAQVLKDLEASFLNASSFNTSLGSCSDSQLGDEWKQVPPVLRDVIRDILSCMAHISEKLSSAEQKVPANQPNKESTASVNDDLRARIRALENAVTYIISPPEHQKMEEGTEQSNEFLSQMKSKDEMAMQREYEYGEALQRELEKAEALRAKLRESEGRENDYLHRIQTLGSTIATLQSEMATMSSATKKRNTSVDFESNNENFEESVFKKNPSNENQDQYDWNASGVDEISNTQNRASEGIRLGDGKGKIRYNFENESEKFDRSLSDFDSCSFSVNEAAASTPANRTVRMVLELEQLKSRVRSSETQLTQLQKKLQKLQSEVTCPNELFLDLQAQQAAQQAEIERLQNLLASGAPNFAGAAGVTEGSLHVTEGSVTSSPQLKHVLRKLEKLEKSLTGKAGLEVVVELASNLVTRREVTRYVNSKLDQLDLRISEAVSAALSNSTEKKIKSNECNNTQNTIRKGNPQYYKEDSLYRRSSRTNLDEPDSIADDLDMDRVQSRNFNIEKGKLDQKERLPNLEQESERLIYSRVMRGVSAHIKDLATTLSRYQAEQAALTHNMYSHRGVWIWRGGQLRCGLAVMWSHESINTDRDNFLWRTGSSVIRVREPGVYSLGFAFFVRARPSIHVLINGVSCVTAVGSASFTLHHNGGPHKSALTQSETKKKSHTLSAPNHLTGCVPTGFSLREYICLPSNSTICLHWNGKIDNITDEGFMELARIV